MRLWVRGAQAALRRGQGNEAGKRVGVFYGLSGEEVSVSDRRELLKRAVALREELTQVEHQLRELTRGETLKEARGHGITMVMCGSCGNTTRSSEPECDWCETKF